MGTAKLAYSALKKKHTLGWDELKNTLLEKQITPKDIETGEMFLLRIESHVEKFEETTNVVLSNGELFEIIVFLLKKTSVNGKMQKYYKKCDNNIESLKKEFLKMAREMYVKPKEIHKTGNDNQRNDKKKFEFNKKDYKKNNFKKNEVNNVDFSNSLDDNKVNDDYKVVYYCKLNDKKMTTRVVIENYNCQALLDTGANISLMSNKLYNKIKDKITIHPLPASFRIMDVQQQLISILGKAKVVLDGQKVEMIVSNNNFGTVDVIVGTNILKNSKRLKTFYFNY
uniref:Peptidase A2 domain-containing protein n=1 Tax=Strongyloides venezuelensis TaxID=75913 RepID=A0A0K0FCB5_STRVS